MEKTCRLNLLGSLTIVISVSVITYGIIAFGRSLERCCSRLSNARTTQIPDSIKVELSSNSLEVASRAIAQGMKNSPSVNIPSNLNLTISSSSLEKASSDLSKAMINSPKVRIPSDVRLRLDDDRGINVTLHRK